MRAVLDTNVLISATLFGAAMRIKFSAHGNAGRLTW